MLEVRESRDICISCCDKNNVFDELQKLKERYKEIRKNTYCRRTEMDDCDSCRADHYLDARLKTIDDCIEILINLGY